MSFTCCNNPIVHDGLPFHTYDGAEPSPPRKVIHLGHEVSDRCSVCKTDLDIGVVYTMVPGRQTCGPLKMKNS